MTKYIWTVRRHWRGKILCMAVWCLLFVFMQPGMLTAAAETGLSAGNAGATGVAESYREAIRNAEKDLATRDMEPTRPLGGWGASELLGLVALAVALILALLASRWLRNSGMGPKSGREMRILDRMAIGKSSTLLLVRLRGRDYLLADHQQGVTLLKEQAADEEAVSVGVSPEGKKEGGE